MIENGQKTTFYVLTDHQCPAYLICVAVGDLVRVDDEKVDDIPISYFAPRTFSKDDVYRAFDKA